jgi:hypothetical protein
MPFVPQAPLPAGPMPARPQGPAQLAAGASPQVGSSYTGPSAGVGGMSWAPSAGQPGNSQQMQQFRQQGAAPGMGGMPPGMNPSAVAGQMPQGMDPQYAMPAPGGMPLTPRTAPMMEQALRNRGKMR